MKKLTSAIVALSFAAAGAASAAAQTSTTPGTSDRPATERGTTERRGTDRASKPERQVWNNPQLHEARDIIGTAVEGPDGKKLGKVENLLMDPSEGKVTHAVIGVGGVMGLGEEKVVVPYSALKMSGHEGGRKAAIRLDQATLDSAPKYARTGDRARGAASPSTTPRSSPSSGTPSTSSGSSPEKK